MYFYLYRKRNILLCFNDDRVNDSEERARARERESPRHGVMYFNFRTGRAVLRLCLCVFDHFLSFELSFIIVDGAVDFNTRSISCVCVCVPPMNTPERLMIINRIYHSFGRSATKSNLDNWDIHASGWHVQYHQFVAYDNRILEKNWKEDTCMYNMDCD